MKLNDGTRKCFALQAITLTIIVPVALAAPEADGSNTRPPSTTTPLSTTTDRSEYVDLPRNHWAYDRVHALSRAGIMEGYEDGRFRGDQPMTRYEFAVAHARSLPCSLGLASQSDVKQILDRLTALENRFKLLEDKVNVANTQEALTQNEMQAVQKEFSAVAQQTRQLVTDASSGHNPGADAHLSK